MIILIILINISAQVDRNSTSVSEGVLNPKSLVCKHHFSHGILSRVNTNNITPNSNLTSFYKLNPQGYVNTYYSNFKDKMNPENINLNLNLRYSPFERLEIFTGGIGML